MDLGLKGRVALVAAASRGLGKAIAWELAREGVDVTICARGKEQLKQAAEEIARSTTSRVLAIAADVTVAKEVTGLVTAVLEQFGRLDILVNNAGGPPPGSFLTFSDEDWRRALELNLISTARLTRAVIPTMRANPSRMNELIGFVKEAAWQISSRLGYQGPREVSQSVRHGV